MMPINEILSKIKWDENFSKSNFEIGYWDRVSNEIIKIQYCDMGLTDKDNFAFKIIDKKGKMRTIPFHRIKRVWKDQELIWSRKIEGEE